MPRIAYFVPGPLSSSILGPRELDRRRSYLASLAFPETEVDVREATGGPESIESVAEECLAMPAILSAIPELESEGFDAVLIGCFDDPGLGGARELTRMPVIGPAQASCHLAAQLGDRFGILTVVEEVIPLLYRLMRSYGLQNHVTDIRAVDVPVLKLESQKKDVLDHLTLEGQAVLAAGADTLILGGMTLGFLDIAKSLEARLGVPVVDPVLASLKAAEGQLAMGARHSLRAYPPPRKKLVPVAV